MEVGVGKSPTMIRILADKYNEAKRIKRTIIFAPPVVLYNWKRELGVWSEVDEKIILVADAAERKKPSFEASLAKAKIVLTNYEAVVSDDTFKRLKAWKPEMMVCDESQRVKTHNAKRTKKVIELSDLCTNRYLLSGTPITNNHMDIWAQFRIMDGGESFGKNFFEFRNRHFVNINATKKWLSFPKLVLRTGAKEKIEEIVSKNAFAARKKDCLDLPPLVRTKYEVDLAPAQKKIYNELKDDLITFIGTAAATAPLVIVKALRLMQIASGFVKLDDGSIHTFEENPKLDVIEEMLPDLAESSKVIIWCVFRENYNVLTRLCDKLKIKYVMLTGDESTKQKQENVDKFQKDPDVRVCIGHPGAGGIGVTLTASNVSIYFSKNFNLDFELQSEGRNHRAGSEIHEKVTRIDLYARDTIEERVLKALADKSEAGDSVMRAVLQEIL